MGEFSPPLSLSPLLSFFFFLSPQPGFDSITLLQKFTPHFKILDPRLRVSNLRNICKLVSISHLCRYIMDIFKI